MTTLSHSGTDAVVDDDVDADDVPLARSPASSNSTLAPLPAASRAIPQPFTPPPITARS